MFNPSEANNGTQTMTLTKEQLAAKVLDPKHGPHWVARILTILLDRQTADEQESNTTSHQNGMGFAGCDAEFGTKVAKFYAERKFITHGQYAAWIKDSRGFPKICKYWRQVNEEIEAKALARTAVEAAIERIKLAA